MPRLVNAVAKYRKHRSSGQAVVTLDGRDHYLGPHGTEVSKTLYDRLVAEWLANGRRAQRSPDEITVVELLARYLRFAKQYDRKNGECTRVYPGIVAAAKYLKDWYHSEPASSIGPVRLKALRDRMIQDGHSRRYINEHFDRIKRMYKWGAAEQLIPEQAYRNVALLEGLKKGRTEARETEPVQPVEDAVVEATLEHLPAVPADMVRLQRATGMRPAEVCIVRACDIDRSGKIWFYRPSTHKTQHHGRERVVALGPTAQGILLKYLARGAKEYCFQPRDSEAKRLAQLHANRKTPLNQGNKPGSNRKRKALRKPGRCYSADSYRRAIHRACDKAFPAPSDLDSEAIKNWQRDHRWSPNRLRHTYATEVRRKFGLEAAQVVLGHASAAVTQVYAERDLAKGEEVARAIG